MYKFLLLLAGGALGTAARWALNGWITDNLSRSSGFFALFPLGTLAVNVSGCFVIGFVFALTEPGTGRVWMKPEVRDFLMVGLCGGFTTFSSYGIQTLSLVRDREWLATGLNIAGSNILGLFAVYLGLVLGLYIQSRL